MIARIISAGVLSASLFVGACSTSNSSSLLRQADQIERDGREYSELLIKYANESATSEDRPELMRYANAILSQSQAVSSIVRKQVSGNPGS